MARSFTVSFNIQGAMDGSLQAALKAAANAMRGLGNAARQASASAAASKTGLAGMANSLNQLQQAAQRYKQVQDALKQSMSDLAKSSQSLQSAKAKYEADAAAVEKLKAKLAELKNAQSKLGTDKASGNATLKQLRQDLANLKKAYAEAKKAGDQLKMSQLGAQIKSTQGAISAQQASAKQMAQAYRELSEQAKKAKAELSAANTAAQKSGADYSAAKSNVQRLAQSYQSQLSALRGLQASLSAAGFSTSGFAAAESRLAADIDRVNAALQRQQALSNAQRQSSQASQEMFNAYNNFQGALSTAGQIAQPFKTATEKAVEFERVMSEVKALTQMDNIKAGRTDVIEKEMSALTAQAKELGATTIYTAQQVGEAQAYIARTGWKTNQILESTPHFLKLAASGHMDMGRAADIATNIMTGFGISAEHAQHVCDVLAYTTTHSNQNLEEMGEAMKYAAPIAKMFGASLEETAAMTKFMADAGIKGSMAGTSMRQTMLRLVAPPKKASKAMQDMGMTVDDATAAWQNANAVAAEYGVTLDQSLTPGRQMLSIVKQIDKKMAGKSSHEKMAAFSAITGINAVSGAMNVFDAGSQALDEFTTALENCDGALEQTYGVMTANTYGALKSMESAWEAVQISIGQALSPIVEQAANAITPMMTAFSQFIDAHPQIVQAAAGIAAALASIIVGAAAVKLAFAGWTFITSSITLVRAALATLADGALLGGLIGRLTALRTALFGLGGAATLGGWSAMFAAISTKAAAAATAIRAFFASLTLGSMASGIAATISSIGTAIAGAARAAMAFAFSPIGVALMALALAGLYVYQNWDKVSAVFSKIAGIISGALGPAITQIQTALNALSSSGGFSALSNAASQAASVIGGTLVKAFAVVLTVAASAVAIIIQLLADLVTIIADIGTGLSEAIGKISEGDFSGAFDALTSAGSKAFSDLKQMGNHVFDGVEQGAKNVQAVIDALNSNVTVASQAATSAGSGMAAGLLAATPATQAAAPETAPIDTSATQAALDQVGNAAQNAATNMDGVNQATQQISQAGTDVQTFSTNAQQAGTEIQTLAQNAQTSGTEVSNFGTAAQTATGGVDAMSTSAGGAVGNISAMSDAAGAVAGALSAKAAEIGSIKISIPQISVGGAAPAANALGGIYPKGQFLTTFAEKSPEAAIPIENSKRARELWTKTGQLLGMLPGNGGSYDSAKKDAFGNIVGMDIPEYNKIGANDTEDVKIDKRRVQREQYEAEREKQRIIRQQAIVTASQQIKDAMQTAQVEAVPKKVSYDDVAKDELGNIKGIDIPEYNRITEKDSEDVRIDKRRVQREQYERERANQKIIQQTTANQSAAQRQALEITRVARENYARQRLGGRRVPTATTERRLSQAEHNRQLREQVLSGKKPLDKAINEVKLPSGATIGDALKRLPPQNNQGIVSKDNYPKTRGNVPMITTPPTVPTSERKSSGVSLVDISQSIPGFKGNIGGFDILGGLTGRNIFGSFGALDGMGGKFPKQGKNPFPSTPVSFGNVLHGLGSLGSFGALGQLGGGVSEIGGLDDLPILNSRSAQNSAPPEFHVTINVTVNGNADENTGRRVADQIVPALDDWARNWQEHQHELARKSFS